MKASCVCEFLVMQDHRVLLSILLLTKVGFECPLTFYIKPALTTPSCARVGSASLLCAFFEPFAMDWALSILTNNCLFHACMSLKACKPIESRNCVFLCTRVYFPEYCHFQVGNEYVFVKWVNLIISHISIKQNYTRVKFVVFLSHLYHSSISFFLPLFFPSRNLHITLSPLVSRQVWKSEDLINILVHNKGLHLYFNYVIVFSGVF